MAVDAPHEGGWMQGGWVDTHCHLDAPEFDTDREAVVERAKAAGVDLLVLPAVAAAHLDAVRELAHRHGFAYALGIHPLFVDRAVPEDLGRLEAALERYHADPHLVAVGEIGLDGFVPGLDMALQEHWYTVQLRLARRFGLPVILHVRRSADRLLKGLRQWPVPGGIAHAFNGSAVQAQAFLERGFALGFGGTLTFEAARQIRRLATELPASALVLETDAPDIPPQWRYRPAAVRHLHPPARNEPAELPRIGQVLGELRGLSSREVAALTAANAARVLPRLGSLLKAPRSLETSP